jgi:hypothetical protein
LEDVGIRIRNWGSAYGAHENLVIRNNTITGTTDSVGVHKIYGVNITASSPSDSIDVFDNTITLGATGTSRYSSAVALQGVDMTQGGSLKVHNNKLAAGTAVQFGGNDGSSVRGISVYNNDNTSSVSGLEYFGWQSSSPQDSFVNNSVYCNKFNNTGTAGYMINFLDPTAPLVISAQWLSNNSITNSNSGGSEVYLNKNYSAGFTSCGNGILDISGGGLITAASDPCHDGVTGCYATAGLMDPDTTAPAFPTGLSVQ